MLCTKPLTYSRIKEERKKSELQGTKLVQQRFEGDEDDEEAQDDEKVLDGFFLVSTSYTKQYQSMISLLLSK